MVDNSHNIYILFQLIIDPALIYRYKKEQIKAGNESNEYNRNICNFIFDFNAYACYIWSGTNGQLTSRFDKTTFGWFFYVQNFY